MTGGTQYYCVNCHAEVQPSATVCPRCGAHFIPETDEITLDEIPLPLDPADIAVLESLLLDNDIEFSIRRQSLESVFGAPLGQNPVLVVRRDQTKAVRTILNDYRASLPPITSPESTSEKGVKSWLLLLCLILTVISPVVALHHLTHYFLYTRPDLVWSPRLVLLIDIRIILHSLLFTAFAVHAGVRLWMVHPHALRSANRFFDVAAVFIGVSFLAYTILFLVLDIPSNAATSGAYNDVLVETIAVLPHVVFWKLYLKYSDRVQATYQS